MKKQLSISLMTLSMLLGLLPQTAHAAKSICPPGSFSGLCRLNQDTAGGAVGSIVTILLIIAVVVTLFFLVWGGIRWTASGGDKAKVEAARHTIVAAIVGLVIAFMAYFITNAVMYIFTGQGVGSMSLPTLY